MDAQDHHPQDLDDHYSSNILKTDQLGPDCDLQHRKNGDLNDDHNENENGDLDDDDDDGIYGENRFAYEPDQLYCTDNNPPESYAVCQAKVADWLDRNTFIERKTSVKFACSKTLDPTQTRPSRRSVSVNQKPKLSIIGFRKKPIHQNEGKSNKQYNYNKAENIRLFRNRSEPGRDYCLLITEPVSPKVSCVGRVGSVRVQGSRKTGFFRSVKTAFSNLVQTNRVTKVVA